MSSMGDIFHTFPAVSDIKSHFPDAEIDWVVEDGFKEIVAWHPGVHDLIPIYLREWIKKHNKKSWKEFIHWKKTLQQKSYDYIIDAQGLVKSTFIAKLAKGKEIHGYDRYSARESMSAWFYHLGHFVNKEQHAVDRTRQFFAKIFGYTLSNSLNFGIKQNFSHLEKLSNKLIFIIGTTWQTKLWSTEEWKKLTKIAITAGFNVEIIWGSASEKEIADEIIRNCPSARRPEQRLSITTIAEKLVTATAVIGLDTGFSHLAGALETPTIALYGPTSPLKVGLIGEHTHNFQTHPALDCMPCHKRQCRWLPENSTLTPECMLSINAKTVWNLLQEKLSINIIYRSTS
jgi:heptosyltransferase I